MGLIRPLLSGITVANTDTVLNYPLVSNTTINCGNCDDFNFSHFLRNDVTFDTVQLFSSEIISCTQCDESALCALVPPLSDSTTNNAICSQGNHGETEAKYAAGPNIQGTVIKCGECSQYGFPVYLRDDLKYDSITEWVPESTTSNGDSSSARKYAGLSTADIIAIGLGVLSAIFLAALFYFFRGRVRARPLNLKSRGSEMSDSAVTNVILK
eukprot:CAMPEP_0185021750 /NCGR_PEP_ID=MMETSP1103-20130426/4456_1 /TAXON_ID=36769 /ORGANISM="Paraphysomonas bandaiensis, Strain Caron Lab Isolate" /LENGTH=211 /DNA_ID=CAMNT_0027553471 /DNA_START=252 /DNA_END=888 /DNA_ORIENTATION=+